MATVTAGGSLKLDMYDTYLGSAFSPVTTILSPALARLAFPNNAEVLLEGSGLLNLGGLVQIGTVTRISESVNGNVSFTVTDTSTPLANLLGSNGQTDGLGVVEDILAGADQVIGTILGDRLFAASGDDVVYGGQGDDELDGGFGDDRLYGEHGDDSLSGGAGNDSLHGGAGADQMVGGTGDDSYIVDHPRDEVVEYADEGTDTVYATGDYALSTGSAVETLTAYDRASTGTLNLTGNEFAQRIIGNDGVNSLRSGGGADVLIGLGGDDSYVVESAAAQIFESVGGGRDTVYATTTFTLGRDAEVEVLLGYDRASTARLDLGGNQFGQTIYGNAGVNSLRGGGGADIFFGLAGDDSILVDGMDDKVYEFTGGGNDTVYTTESFALLSDAEVETLTVYERNTNNAVNLTGSNTSNRIIGNDGANVVDGKGGSDSLFGLGGADTFSFSTTLGSDNVDTIYGFVSGSDRIQLSASIFGDVSTGALTASAFSLGSAAADADDRIIYDRASGSLWYDADGIGSVSAVQFAFIGQGTALAASDFFIG